MYLLTFFFFFSSRRRHTRSDRDWSSDVCSPIFTVRLAMALPKGAGLPAGSLRDDIALRIESNADRSAVLHRIAAPNRLRILLQVGHLGVTLRREPAARLRLGEAAGRRGGGPGAGYCRRAGDRKRRSRRRRRHRRDRRRCRDGLRNRRPGAEDLKENHNRRNSDHRVLPTLCASEVPEEPRSASIFEGNKRCGSAAAFDRQPFYQRSLSARSKFSSTASSRPPTVFCTLPSAFLSLPSASIFLSPRALPAFSLMPPTACLPAPTIRSLFMIRFSCDFGTLKSNARRIGRVPRLSRNRAAACRRLARSLAPSAAPQ